MIFRPLPWLTVVTVIALIILVSFGNWQMRRLAWKEDLIAQTTSRTVGDARAIDAVLAETTTLDERNFWRVSATGVFDHAREIHYYRVNVDNGVPGYNIITPLVREGEPTLLVNRGFVPLDKKDPRTRPGGQTNGSTMVTGLMRVPGPQGRFVPDNQPAENMWYHYDIAAMADAAGQRDVLPVILEAGPESNVEGGPEGGQTQLFFKNDHLGYAITWYGLALSLLAIYVVFHVNQGRLKLTVARKGMDL